MSTPCLSFNRSFTLRTADLPTLEKLVLKLNKRAKKLGMEPIAFVVTGTQDIVREQDKQQFVIQQSNITLSGIIPFIEGWQFAAKLEAAEAGTLLQKSPSFTKELPAKYRQATNTCDHCNKRRNRNDTYLLYCESEDQYKQVGKQCLADFFPSYRNPETVAGWLEDCNTMIRECSDLEKDNDREPNGGGYGGGRLYEPEYILRHMIAYIRLNGYMSKATAEMRMTVSTAQIFGNILANVGRVVDKKVVELDVPTDDDKAKAANILAWVKAEAAKSTCNDFMHNVNITLNSGIPSWKLGYIGGAISSYNKMMGDSVASKVKLVSSHIGKVGERTTFKGVTVRSTYSYDTHYGTSTLVSFVTPEGNVLVWRASGVINLENGTTINLTGSIKEHGEYKGTKQTSITRCKWEVVNSKPEMALQGA